MNKRNQNKPKFSRTGATFMGCVLGVPTCVLLLPGFEVTDIRVAVLVGAALGVAYLIIRPVLRLLTLPLGCLTLGLFNSVIDVGLLYGCARLFDGFEITGVLSAIICAGLIGALCGILGRSK